MNPPQGPSTSQTLLAAMLGRPWCDSAWATFQERYRALIRHWCARYGLQDAAADDVAADVVFKLLTELPKYDAGRRFRGWLRTVVCNKALDHLRDLKRHPGHRGSGDTAVLELLERLQSPEAAEDLGQTIDGQLSQDVRLVVARVKGRVEDWTWGAFWSYHCEGRPAAEVAETLGMKPHAVHQAVYRVGKLLKEEFQSLVGTAKSTPEAGHARLPGQQRPD